MLASQYVGVRAMAAVAFKILDTDNSGQVDAKEFGKLLQALHRRAGKLTATLRNVGHPSSGGK